MKTLNLDTGLTVAYNFEEILIPLPTVFYFTLSKEASLNLDPFNQFTNYLKPFQVRVISFDLPFHSTIESFHKAIEEWNLNFEKGIDILTPFFQKVSLSIDELIKKKIVDPDLISVAGLSRGAFIACHVAAINSNIHTVLGFAPLSALSYIKEFKESKFELLDLIHITSKLIGKNLRFYIGNQDIRVGTQKCFEFIHRLAQANQEARIRPINVELIIQASHGHQGHGTLPPVFEDGAIWLKNKLII